MRITIARYPVEAYQLEKRPLCQGWITATSIVTFAMLIATLLISLVIDPFRALQWSCLLYLVLVPAAFVTTYRYNLLLQSRGRNEIKQWETNNLGEYNRVNRILRLPYTIARFEKDSCKGVLNGWIESPRERCGRGNYSEHCQDMTIKLDTALAKEIIQGTVKVIHFPEAQLYRNEAGEWFHKWGEPVAYIEV